MRSNWARHGELFGTWHYGICDKCLHNSHETEKMVKQEISVCGHPNSDRKKEVWVCTACGYQREF